MHGRSRGGPWEAKGMSMLTLFKNNNDFLLLAEQSRGNSPRPEERIIMRAQLFSVKLLMFAVRKKK